MKTISTVAHQLVAKSNTKNVWFLTATPIANRVLDCAGTRNAQPVVDKSLTIEDWEETEPINEHKYFSNQDPIPSLYQGISERLDRW